MTELTCDGCGHIWQSRTPNPIKCPQCQRSRRKPVPALLRFKVFSRDNFTCIECGFRNDDGEGLHVHHTIPLSQNGPTEMENLETLCSACHDARHKSPGKTKFYRSKTYALSEEVVAVIKQLQSEGVSLNQLLTRIFDLGKINPNGEIKDDSDIEEMRQRHRQAISEARGPRQKGDKTR